MRRAEPAITIRSRKAVDLLKELTRHGKSQVAVIEEALEKAAGAEEARIAAARAVIREAQQRIQERGGPFPTMAEFDVQEYDENGLLR